MDPITLFVTQLLNIISENIHIPEKLSLFDDHGCFQIDEFRKLSDEAKAAFTLFVLLEPRSYRYRDVYKCIKAIERPYAQRKYCVNGQQLAVFFMADKERGIYFHPRQGMIYENFIIHEELYKNKVLANKVKRVLEEKKRSYVIDLLKNLFIV